MNEMIPSVNVFDFYMKYIMFVLEQGPAAIGKAAIFGRIWTIFGGKTILAMPIS